MYEDLKLGYSRYNPYGVVNNPKYMTGLDTLKEMEMGGGSNSMINKARINNVKKTGGRGIKPKRNIKKGGQTVKKSIRNSKMKKGGRTKKITTKNGKVGLKKKKSA